MDAAQAAKLDAIYGRVRPRFMTLRDLPAEERPKARERISADVRARISDILTPEQKPATPPWPPKAAGRRPRAAAST
jgi:HlyD family secretion protein